MQVLNFYISPLTSYLSLFFDVRSQPLQVGNHGHDFAVGGHIYAFFGKVGAALIGLFFQVILSCVVLASSCWVSSQG